MAEILPELLLKFRTEVTSTGEEKIKAVEGSIKEASNAILHFKKTLDVTSASSAENVKKLQDLQNHYLKLTQSVKASNTPFDQLLKSNQQMSQAVLNMNYILRDSPYFMRNFGMGIMAIGNNLNPLIDSIIRANQEAKALGTTFSSVLMKTLGGATGIMFAASIAVAAFQAITFAIEGAKEETKKQADELGNLKRELEGLTSSEAWKKYDAFLGMQKSKEEISLVLGATQKGRLEEIDILIGRLEETRKKMSDIFVIEKKETKPRLFGKEWLENLKKANQEVPQYAEHLTKSTTIVKDQNKYLRETAEINKKINELIEEKNKILGIDEKEKKPERIKKEKSELEELVGTTYAQYQGQLTRIREILKDTNLIMFDRVNLLDKEREIFKKLDPLYEMYEDAVEIAEEFRKEAYKGLIEDEESRIKGINIKLQEQEDAAREVLKTQREQLQVQKDQAQAALQLVSAMGQLSNKTDNFLGQLANVLKTIIQISAIMKSMEVGEKAGGIDETTGYLSMLASIFNMFGRFFHKGGIVKAHSGLLARDEVPIIAQAGERILSREENRRYEMGWGNNIVQKIYLNVDSKNIMEFVVKPNIKRTLEEVQRERRN